MRLIVREKKFENKDFSATTGEITTHHLRFEPICVSRRQTHRKVGA